MSQPYEIDSITAMALERYKTDTKFKARVHSALWIIDSNLRGKCERQVNRDDYGVILVSAAVALILSEDWDPEPPNYSVDMIKEFNVMMSDFGVPMREQTRIALQNYDYLIRHKGLDRVELVWEMDTLMFGEGGSTVDVLCETDFTPGPQESDQRNQDYLDDADAFYMPHSDDA